VGALGVCPRERGGGLAGSEKNDGDPWLREKRLQGRRTWFRIETPGRIGNPYLSGDALGPSNLRVGPPNELLPGPPVPLPRDVFRPLSASSRRFPPVLEGAGEPGLLSSASCSPPRAGDGASVISRSRWVKTTHRPGFSFSSQALSESPWR